MTGSAATIDLDSRSVTRTVRIRASREAVWRALTEAEHLARWFGDDAELGEPVAGARGRLHWAGHGWFPIEVTEAEPFEAFAFTWSHTPEDLDLVRSTHARFTLATEGGETVLTVTETGFERVSAEEAGIRSALEDNRQGWDSELDELVAYVESALA